MFGTLLLVAAAFLTPAQASNRAPPTAQELGYPEGCTAIYGGTGGIHLIRVDCPPPDLSEIGRDLAKTVACAGAPTRLKADRTGLKPDDYECLPFPSSKTLEELGLVAVDVTEDDEVFKRAAAFERDFRADGNTIQLRDCRLIVMITAGRGDSNKSYGGVCQAMLPPSEPERIMVCNDEIAGHFATASQLPPTREAVIEFVKQHCVGG